MCPSCSVNGVSKLKMAKNGGEGTTESIYRNLGTFTLSQKPPVKLHIMLSGHHTGMMMRVPVCFSPLAHLMAGNPTTSLVNVFNRHLYKALMCQIISIEPYPVEWTKDPIMIQAKGFTISKMGIPSGKSLMVKSACPLLIEHRNLGHFIFLLSKKWYDRKL